MERTVPEACIQKPQLPDFPRMSFCNVQLRDKDFAFTDVSYAVMHYADGKTIRACPECVAACQHLVNQHGDTAPWALRGLGSDRSGR